MPTENPTKIEWKKLYDLAIKFEKLAPWQWLADTDVFGVRSPETGETGYLSIMGMSKGFYGLAIYLGAEGFEILDRTLKNLLTKKEGKYVQKCLMLSFDKRDYIDKVDMAIIKDIGVSFDNMNFWPQFRDYSPGFYPWYLNQTQVRFFILVLEQALEMVLEFKDNMEKYRAKMPNIFPVRVANKNKRAITWTTEFLAPEHKRGAKFYMLNENFEIRVRQLKKEIVKEDQMIWELDCFYYSQAVRKEDSEKSRPYFPKLLMAVDKESGAVLASCLSEPSPIQISNYRQALFDAFLKHGICPEEIHIRDRDLLKIIFPLTEIFKIKVEPENNLKMFDVAKKDLEQSLGFRRFIEGI